MASRLDVEDDDEDDDDEEDEDPAWMTLLCELLCGAAGESRFWSVTVEPASDALSEDK